MKFRAKKINIRPAIILLLTLTSVTLVVGLNLGFIFLGFPLIAPILGAAIALGSFYYFYRSIKKTKNALPKLEHTPVSMRIHSIPRFETKTKPVEPEYTQKCNPKLQAELGKYTPSQTSNQHTKLGRDTLTFIAQYLTPLEATRLKQTDSTLNKAITFENHKPTQKLFEAFSNSQTKEEKIVLFKKECALIKDHYPQELIDACGIQAIAALPIINLSATTKDKSRLNKDYISFVTVEQLNGQKAVRGIHRNRAFISLCIEDSLNPPSVVTVFQRYTDDKANWQTSGAAEKLLPDANHNYNTEGRKSVFACVADLLHNSHPTLRLASTKEDNLKQKQKTKKVS